MSGKVVLSLEDIVLSFGGAPLFDGMTVHVHERDRICLIGRNGVGKSTLMKLMIQELELDAGRRFVLPGTSIGYLAQQVQSKPGETVKEFVLSGLPKVEQTEENHYLAEMVIAPLDLSPTAEMQPLSGGQKRRAALARSLVQNPDILLLDEPTNHLDIEGIEWLEGYLQSYQGAVVCVSHDRRFLANISDKVLWIDRGNVRTCPEGYAGFEDWMEKQIEQEARELQNLQKKVQAEHGWTQGGVTARRKRNVRRMRELHRLRDKLKQDKAAYKQRSQKIEMDALDAPAASKIMAEFKKVDFSFVRDDGTKLPILHDFNHMILKGDRVGILGRNGSGKSTFLKLLVGDLQPENGFIFRSKTMNCSYFDQNRTEADPDKTLWETLCPNGGQDVFLGSGENQRTVHVCGYLKKFLFDPSIARDKVGTLSGGQQNRLLLAKLLASPGNLLILDEPTNDLDMDTLDMLQEMLADYPGTLIIVSHDRDFLDRTVTEIIGFEGEGEVHSAMGGYSDYEREFGQKKSAVSEAKSKSSEAKQAAITPNVEQAKPLSFKEQYEYDNLPKKIADLEQHLADLQLVLSDADLYMRDPEGFDAVTTAYEKAKAELDEAELRWLTLEERVGG